MTISARALLRLVWVSCGPSLGRKSILAALGCSRTSKESTEASPALPGSAKTKGGSSCRLGTGSGLGPCDHRCELSRAGRWAHRMPQRPVIRVSHRQLNHCPSAGRTLCQVPHSLCAVTGSIHSTRPVVTMHS